MLPHPGLFGILSGRAQRPLAKGRFASESAPGRCALARRVPREAQGGWRATAAPFGDSAAGWLATFLGPDRIGPAAAFAKARPDRGRVLEGCRRAVALAETPGVGFPRHRGGLAERHWDDKRASGSSHSGENACRALARWVPEGITLYGGHSPHPSLHRRRQPPLCVAHPIAWDVGTSYDPRHGGWPREGGTRTVHGSSITGRFIKPSTARRHPKTSIRQRVSAGQEGQVERAPQTILSVAAGDPV